MLFPIADDNTTRTSTPFVNYALIAVNILVFVFLQGLGSNDQFTYAYSTVPGEIITGRDIVTRPVVVENFTGQRLEMPGLQPTLIPVYLTLITSMFMHGGLAHIFGNMLFLWIFGDNIEDRLGHIRYLIFYLICGILAGLAHVFVTYATAADASSLLVPSLGASGAISGVLGGYLLLFPTNRVIVLLSWFVTPVPAFVAIGLWFVFQLISGLGMLGSGSKAGGVAYGAHIGGFIAGLLLIKVFEIGRPPPDRYYEREF
ncbi:MAG TPA: rhomboid family intramembrane serine protease [Pyrinomonadaceae bacterium]|jgi:membrane associated rhomboid family serine protease|nr:rhomboid family intramembrane serine protease [Pyrinomonadaceae bacterium]